MTHPYSPFVDEFGMSIPPCECGREQPIPGGRECPGCLIARVHQEDQIRRFGPYVVFVEPA